MGAKEEIERRLRKSDYTKISKELFDKTFDNLEDNEYKNVLKIADKYGVKYKKFYKLKNSDDINTIISNLNNISYEPNLTTHKDLKVINIVKNDNKFTLYAEFYTLEEVWKIEDYGGVPHKVPYKEYHRRIMCIDKMEENDYIVISIDPIGEGAKVYKEIDLNIKKLSEILHLDFDNYLDNISLKNEMFTLVRDEVLIAKGLNAIDEETKRTKSVNTGASKDNIKDDDFYKECEQNALKAENLKMKYNKDSLELFGDTLIKITTRINGTETDELTKQITSILS